MDCHASISSQKKGKGRVTTSAHWALITVANYCHHGVHVKKLYL